MSSDIEPILIVGAGIAGLSAGWALQRAGHGDFSILEAAERVGGVLRTEVVDGFVLEAGPDSFLSAKPAAAALCRELGMTEDLRGSLPARRRTAIVRRNRLVELPEGWQFLAPTKAGPLLTTRLLSPQTKLLLALRWLGWTAPGAHAADEAVGAFVRRHFGREVAEVVAAPLLSGVYGGDPEALSLEAVLPRYAQIAGRANLLRTLWREARKAAPPRERTAAPLFTTLKSGIGSLPLALAERLRSHLRLGAKVRRVEFIDPGYRVTLEDGTAIAAARLILAIPAWGAADLLQPLDRALAAALREIPYASAVTINLGFRESPPLPEGYGFLVPRSEGRRLMACTFVHQKFPERVSPGAALLRVFYGGSGDEGVLEESDAALQALAVREVEEILGLSLRPDLVRIQRWWRAMAQYTVGHRERLERIRARLESLPGLLLAGNAYGGIGIPDCIASGRAAAEGAMAGSGSVPAQGAPG